MMKNLIKMLRVWLVTPVNRQKAVQIAKQAIVPNAQHFHVFSRKPQGVNVYNLPAEPYWCVFVPWGDGKDGRMLRSSHLLLISKFSGRVLYDGSANDEG